MSNNDYRILLVDDEPDILEFLGYNLRKEGFQVSTARNGKEAIAVAVKTHPHLIVLDVMMPGMDGMETCRELRQKEELKDTIITFLTARGEDYSQMAGFEAGGDDYIAKPIKPGLLISRVKALLRRYPGETNPGTRKHIGRLIIDREKYMVFKDGDKIVLPKKEFELLFLLTSKPNKVFTREEIFSRVWGSDVVVGDRTIDVHIRKLREKLGQEHIQTVKGIGYKFEE